jgi:transcription elongation factor
VKKKLTLGDYMSRRGNLATPTAEKSQSQLEPAGHHTPTYSADGSSPTVSLTGGKSGGESIKQESPATPDAVMKDVQISSTTTEISPSLPRDPRLQPRT